MEEVTLRAVIRHLGLTDSINRLNLLEATEPDGDEYRHVCEVMGVAFSRLDRLVRRRMAMAEAEQKWSRDVADVRRGELQPSAAFFNDYHLQEVSRVSSQIQPDFMSNLVWFQIWSSSILDQIQPDFG